MTNDDFNPLMAVAKKTKSRQSVELAPDPVESQKFDTTTPAYIPKEPRRFDLGDLPRFADALYPMLKKLFPHINDRMYGGWIRGCINDNSCLFICVDGTDDGTGGAVGMAFIDHEPLNPVPYIDMLFVIGATQYHIDIYNKVVKWGKEVGAKEVRVRDEMAHKGFLDIQGLANTPHDRNTVILSLE